MIAFSEDSAQVEFNRILKNTISFCIRLAQLLIEDQGVDESTYDAGIMKKCAMEQIPLPQVRAILKTCANLEDHQRADQEWKIWAKQKARDIAAQYMQLTTERK